MAPLQVREKGEISSLFYFLFVCFFAKNVEPFWPRVAQFFLGLFQGQHCLEIWEPFLEFVTDMGVHLNHVHSLSCTQPTSHTHTHKKRPKSSLCVYSVKLIESLILHEEKKHLNETWFSGFSRD